MDEIAERALAGIEQPRDLVLGEILDDGRIDGPEGFHATPGVVARDHALPPGVIEGGLEVGQHPVGAGAAAAHRFGIVAVERAVLGAAPTRERQ